MPGNVNRGTRRGLKEALAFRKEGARARKADVTLEIASGGSSPVESVSVRAVIQRISEIAALSPTEAASRMGTEKGSQIARLETEAVETEGLLRSWKSIGRASPKPLTDEQYEKFLNGDHPVTDAAELYGAHLKAKPKAKQQRKKSASRSPRKAGSSPR